jgi:hypothetical protein
MIFKTTEQILNEPWERSFLNMVLPAIKFEVAPPAVPLDNLKEPELADIKLWELIYYKGAHVGIWAAWNPRVEFYIVTYNLFLDIPQGIQVFSGPDAKRQIWKLAKELNVTLPINKIWVETADESDNSLEDLL